MAARGQQSSGLDPRLTFGAIFGVASFLVGYVTTLVVAAVGEDLDDLIEEAGWLYYNAQFADIELGGGEFGEFFGIDFDQEVNLITDNGLDVPSIVYHLIPILVLTAAGFVLARRVGAREPPEGALAGAALVVGTVVMALLGTFLFEAQDTSPVLVEGLLLVGVIFPGVFGAIGGVLSTVVGDNGSQRGRGGGLR